MFRFPSFRLQYDRPSARRLRAGHRPLVEDLEGRRLLSGIQGNHIGVSVAVATCGYSSGGDRPSVEIVGSHIGVSANGATSVHGSGGGGGAGKVGFQ